MRTNLVSVLCLAAGLVICAGPGLAQDRNLDRTESQGDAKAREACTPDVMRLCDAYIPDVPSIVACLKYNRTNLSPACGEIFAAEEPPAPQKVAKTTPAKKKTEKKAEKKPETLVAEKTEKKKPQKVGAPLNLSATAKATR